VLARTPRTRSLARTAAPRRLCCAPWPVRQRAWPIGARQPATAPTAAARFARMAASGGGGGAPALPECPL